MTGRGSLARDLDRVPRLLLEHNRWNSDRLAQATAGSGVMPLT
jgi:hypothetical protein